MAGPYNIVDDPRYRPNVGIMLINPVRQIMAGETLYYPGEWMMPQGGIDVGESPFQAMQRELMEETGIDYGNTRLIREHDEWLSYLLRQPLVKEGRVYTGQRQKWFLLEYAGPLPDATQTQDREFIRFDWVEPAWLIEHTTKFKISLYREIFTAFDFNDL
jgi:putative (di)nucleoside polyphosphate hydrolase